MFKFKPEKVFLDFNASKVRWLTNSKIHPTDLFCLGSGENEVIDQFYIQ